MHDFDTLTKEIQDQIIAQARKQYSEGTIDHWLRPRSFGRLDDPDGHALRCGSCGEMMEIFVKLRAGKIAAAGYLTDGCITAIASGSMAVELARGQSATRARAISPEDILDGLGGLPAESRHCAELAASTLRAAVDQALAVEREPWKKTYQRRSLNE